ncbi:peritrophin-48-like isoform X1 [Zophobas morio]|uniref:peritrophin-48-like isoform X1 n=1 Tax=Zophobas morio TaxID=2755281 RepID=UPI0030826F95
MALGKSLVLLTLVGVFVLVSFTAAADCDGLPANEMVPIPHDVNCSLYYACYNGDKTLMTCDDGLHFNPTAKACDFPEVAGCLSADQCTGVNLDYLPYPADCSRYVECFNGNSYLMECPYGYYFDSGTKMCTIPVQSDCVNPPWTTPNPLCWNVRPEQTVLIADTDDCQKYWECRGSVLTHETCPPYLLFDESRQLCDFPEFVNCEGPTPTPDPDFTTSDTDDPRCADMQTSYWPHPTLCDVYIECYRGHSYQMDCPPGLYFSAIAKKCVPPGQSECGRTTPTEGPTYPSDWTGEPDCPYPESEGDLSPVPGDCTKFYECAGGKKVRFDCPPNLWFSVNYNECVYPYQSECTWSKLSFLNRIYKFVLRY